MVTMFIDTHSSPYYDKVMGSVASNFADLVVVGERIKLGIRREKLTQANSNVGFGKKLPPKKRKGEANATLIEPQGIRRPPRMLTPIPMTYTELLPQLLEQNLVEIVPPYPRSYDPNAKCDYHGGAVGHAIERC
ncbi:hypothetical protein CR513_20032, partial [Mucuna pruriens]